MLNDVAHTKPQQHLADQIARYVNKVLHAQIRLKPRNAPENLPVFMASAYDFFTADIANEPCLLMLIGNQTETPGDVAKQVHLVREETRDITIVGVPALSARDRSRLIGQRVSFIVPGNQFYVPELGLDLREHYRSKKSRPENELSPAAQAVFFHHMLRCNEAATTPSDLAKDLNYSPMSIGRAFDDLASLNLAVTERHGRERHIQFREDRGTLLENARTMLRSPVRSRKHVWGPHERARIMVGGETALARLTDLAPPEHPEFAITSSEWKGFLARAEFQEDDIDEGDFIVETWGYDPRGLSDKDIVDPLSLYAQFWNHEDERVSMAAEQLLERMPW